MTFVVNISKMKFFKLRIQVMSCQTYNIHDPLICFQMCFKLFTAVQPTFGASLARVDAKDTGTMKCPDHISTRLSRGGDLKLSCIVGTSKFMEGGIILYTIEHGRIFKDE